MVESLKLEIHVSLVHVPQGRDIKLKGQVAVGRITPDGRFERYGDHE